ncbi:hypothetical protein ABF87_11890 [Nitrosomonas sp. JL21]|uniref:Ig-like domain-containing protein n=1 Tax=Nitrosomonas sp. JL21 TaxID=153949 RepID=UPI001372133F|nr:Ig-like domain-containing protein [Nitrosomonas sp.]MXS78643.1 hypothetical protein [Nitrosomonas sp. JL21]
MIPYQVINPSRLPTIDQLNSAILLSFTSWAPPLNSGNNSSDWDFNASFSTSITTITPPPLFAFEAIAGATYDIFSESYYDPSLLQLFDEQGASIAAGDQSGVPGMDHIKFIAPYDGRYYVDASWRPGFADATQYASISVYEDLDTQSPLFSGSIPTIETFSPANSSTGVAVNSDIMLTFSELIQRGSGFVSIQTTENTLIESYNIANSPNISISGRTLIINPTNDLLSNRQYFVSIDSGAIKDLVGNGNAQTGSYNFTTAAASPVVLPDVERVFDWGENRYSALFPDHPGSIDIFGYHARLYSNGNAIGEQDQTIYFYDGGAGGTGNIILVGTTAELLSLAISDGF